MQELEQGLREAGIHTPDMQGIGMNSSNAASDPWTLFLREYEDSVSQPIEGLTSNRDRSPDINLLSFAKTEVSYQTNPKTKRGTHFKRKLTDERRKRERKPSQNFLGKIIQVLLTIVFLTMLGEWVGSLLGAMALPQERPYGTRRAWRGEILPSSNYSCIIEITTIRTECPNGNT